MNEDYDVDTDTDLYLDIYISNILCTSDFLPLPLESPPAEMERGSFLALTFTHLQPSIFRLKYGLSILKSIT